MPDPPLSPAANLSALADLGPRIEAALTAACQFGDGCPEHLAAAMRYALLAPGKRLRPALVLMAAEACGGSLDQAMPGAVAVEMIHAYSLIHDDLPAMDDDDLRRGRPTVHIQFDEATAILAGDALQAQAFLHLAEHVDDPLRLAAAIRLLARAAGCTQLIGGQADDLAAEKLAWTADSSRPIAGGQAADEREDSAAPETTVESEPSAGRARTGNRRFAEADSPLQLLESIHRRKTGALFAASLALGAILSGADDRSRQALGDYARDLGLAFQVVDDLLDFTADAASLGKRAGKDADRGKLTYPGLLGLQPARDLAAQLVESAKKHASVFDAAAWRLTSLADYVLERTH